MMTLEITQRAREIAARTTHCGATGQAIIAGRLDMDQRVQAAQLALNECAAEIERLRGAVVGEWFYSEGYSSEDCYYSPDEVIEYLDLNPGNHLVQINVASPLPSIWAVVHVLTKDEMVAAETDDHETYTLYPSEAEAQKALDATNDPR